MDPVAPLSAWYAGQRRDLPWRGAAVGPWGVLVSEVMLQQTPVVRVEPAFRTWMDRWPAPRDLAAEAPGEAVRAWGRLGYPRRALRLHAAAVQCVERFEGEVPVDDADLRSLPGVGDYTAAAVAAFAYGRRRAVLDTNVRRVHARLLDGAAFPSSSAPTVGERARALDLLPPDGPSAATFSVAVMELGALVCTARAPRCDQCPVSGACAWRAAGSPAWDGPPRRGQNYDGTDRQCRGRLLAVLRETDGPVLATALEPVWPDPVQRARALDGLVADGLVEPLSDAGPTPALATSYRLPTHHPPPR